MPCLNYHRGKCDKGRDCEYSHKFKEAAPASSSSASSNGDGNAKKKRNKKNRKRNKSKKKSTHSAAPAEEFEQTEGGSEASDTETD